MASASSHPTEAAAQRAALREALPISITFPRVSCPSSQTACRRQSPFPSHQLQDDVMVSQGQGGSHALASLSPPLAKSFHVPHPPASHSLLAKNITKLLKLLLSKANASPRKRVPSLPERIIEIQCAKALIYPVLTYLQALHQTCVRFPYEQHAQCRSVSKHCEMLSFYNSSFRRMKISSPNSLTRHLVICSVPS